MHARLSAAGAGHGDLELQLHRAGPELGWLSGPGRQRRAQLAAPRPDRVRPAWPPRRPRHPPTPAAAGPAGSGAGCPAPAASAELSSRRTAAIVSARLGSPAAPSTTSAHPIHLARALVPHCNATSCLANRKSQRLRIGAVLSFPHRLAIVPSPRLVRPWRPAPDPAALAG